MKDDPIREYLSDNKIGEVRSKLTPQDIISKTDFFDTTRKQKKFNFKFKNLFATAAGCYMLFITFVAVILTVTLNDSRNNTNIDIDQDFIASGFNINDKQFISDQIGTNNWFILYTNNFTTNAYSIYFYNILDENSSYISSFYKIAFKTNIRNMSCWLIVDDYRVEINDPISRGIFHDDSTDTLSVSVVLNDKIDYYTLSN